MTPASQSGLLWWVHKHYGSSYRPVSLYHINLSALITLQNVRYFIGDAKNKITLLQYTTSCQESVFAPLMPKPPLITWVFMSLKTNFMWQAIITANHRHSFHNSASCLIIYKCNYFLFFVHILYCHFFSVKWSSSRAHSWFILCLSFKSIHKLFGLKSVWSLAVWGSVFGIFMLTWGAFTL